jgi:hypothetical protein
MNNDPAILIFTAELLVILTVATVVLMFLAKLILRLFGYEIDKEPKLDVDFMKRLDNGEVLTADNMFSKYEN